MYRWRGGIEMDYTDIYKEDVKKPQNEIVSPASAPTTPVDKQTESGSFKFCRECGSCMSVTDNIYIHGV